jgi:hypothetical protein
MKTSPSRWNGHLSIVHPHEWMATSGRSLTRAERPKVGQMVLLSHRRNFFPTSLENDDAARERESVAALTFIVVDNVRNDV